MSVHALGVSKSFSGGHSMALDDITFHAAAGGITTLLGPSGSGKSTLLRILGGLDAPDRGTVRFGDDDVTQLPAQRRGVGFVFQNYALFPTMNVRDNVAFGLSLRKKKRKEIDARVDHLLSLVQLSGLERRFPSELSGGQRQRVAFARALAIEPQVLLLDEPFGALDARVRLELRDWLRSLHEKTRLTTILVTHDQDEALEVSHYLVVMNNGKIEQMGRPEDVYDRPESPFVASFIGCANILPGTIKNGRASVGDLLLDPPDGAHEGDGLSAYVQAHQVDVTRVKRDGEVAGGTIERIVRRGDAVRLALRLPDGGTLTVNQTRAQFFALAAGVGDHVFISLRGATLFFDGKPRALHWKAVS
ncbi:MAG: sulfate ABC transporter ATP-binding protein [Polyangiales bacterium]